jgi:hypothetical protein
MKVFLTGATGFIGGAIAGAAIAAGHQITGRLSVLKHQFPQSLFPRSVSRCTSETYENRDPIAPPRELRMLLFILLRPTTLLLAP